MTDNTTQSEIRHIHDKYFRFMMGNNKVHQDFCHKHLPFEVQEQVNIQSTQAVDTAFIDESLAKSEADSVFKLNLKDSKETAYLLIEHQSAADKRMPLRILKYMIAIMEAHHKSSNDKHFKLPFVYSMMLFHKNKPYPYERSLSSLMNKNVQSTFDKHCYTSFDIIEISKWDDKNLYKHKYANLLEMFLYCTSHQDKLEIIYKHEVYLKELYNADYKLVLASFSYLISYLKEDKHEKLKTLFERFETTIGGTKMTLAEQLFGEARAEGIEQGIEQGIEVTNAHIAVKMLKSGFDYGFIKEYTNFDDQQLSELKKKIKKEYA